MAAPAVFNAGYYLLDQVSGISTVSTGDIPDITLLVERDMSSYM